jgi:hypothetical protein
MIILDNNRKRRAIEDERMEGELGLVREDEDRFLGSLHKQSQTPFHQLPFFTSRDPISCLNKSPLLNRLQNS